MNSKNIISFILLFIPLPIIAQKYEGTIGNSKIFLEIEQYNGKSQGYYFYKNKLRNIKIEGYKTNDSIVLHNLSDSDKDRFELKNNNGELSGMWRKGGLKYPVQLIDSSLDFQKFKQSKTEFETEIIDTIDGKELIWIKEKKSNIRLFRLGNGFTQEQKELINPQLESIQVSNVKQYFECEWYDITNNLGLVSDKYVCFTESSHTNCGGAHPNYGYISYNFDLETGKILSNLKELYPKLDYYSKLKEMYGDSVVSSPNFDTACDYFGENNKSVWEYHNWLLVPDGLEITPSFSHAMIPCRVSFVIPYEEIEEK